MDGVPFDINVWGLVLTIFANAIRVGTPYLFVSIGECITERAGRVNLGLEGTLVMGAMSGFGVCYLGTKYGLPPEVAPWLGVLAAGVIGACMGALHALICNRPRVNSVAVGIAMMVFGVGLAAYIGTTLVKPKAPRLPDIDFGFWSADPAIRDTLRINALFLVGAALAPLLAWLLYASRWGLLLRLAGESEDAASALGYSVNRIRLVATTAGGVLAGIGGSFLSLYYPGNWNERISTGQGLMAVALVIFARWNPINCLWAALLFGGVGSIGLALKGQNLVGPAAGYLWNTAPCVLTLAIMFLTSSRARAMIGAPMELARVR